jgi:hypothetical protein
MGTFGRVEIALPRARLNIADGKTTEWKGKALRTHQRRTRHADALIAGSYLAGTNTRRVRRALSAVFGGAVSKGTVSRVWPQGKRRLGCVECPLARRGTHCPLDPGRHCGAGPARPEGEINRPPGRAPSTWHLQIDGKRDGLSDARRYA